MAFKGWLDVGGVQMSCNTDFKEWLNRVRFSRNVCMLIPMEAYMGHPIVVKQGVEYIIPFFRALSITNFDSTSPPFAYLRVKYPSMTILTYNNLRTLPEWKNIDWTTVVKNDKNNMMESKFIEYYKEICCSEISCKIVEQYDELLLDCFCMESNDNNSFIIAEWYKKLISEAKKYR